MTLLKQGFKINLSHKRNHWLSNLALEAENAIMLLPTHEQDSIRQQVAYNLQKNYTNSKKSNTQAPT